MPAVLAIDTSTDACSVAFASGESVRSAHRIIPRAHNQHIFHMIDEVLAGRELSAIDRFICGVGPGSFTGLRIAAGVVQGLAWSLDKPVIPICSLEAQARSTDVSNARWVLSTTDAQIGQIYWRWFEYQGADLCPVGDPCVTTADSVMAPPDGGECVVVGSGCADHTGLRDNAALASCIYWQPEIRPHAEAIARWAQVQTAVDAVAPALLSPRYVQQTIGWKKLSEQPRRG